MTINLTDEDGNRFLRIFDRALKNQQLGGMDIYADVTFAFTKLAEAKTAEVAKQKAANEPSLATMPPAQPAAQG